MSPSAAPGGRVLLVFAHPSYERSRAARALLAGAGIGEAPVEGVTFHDLYEAYPDFMINVRREQALLLAHDVILLQFPLHWYATPALLKEWFDVVWLHGFAYGDEGEGLAGKTLGVVTTTGGEAASYGLDARHGYSVEEFLRPIERTAHLCGMRWDPPMVVHSDELDRAAGPYRDRIAALAGQGRRAS